VRKHRRGATCDQREHSGGLTRGEGSGLWAAADTENGPTNPQLRKALDKSFHLLDIFEFVKVTKFELNMVMFDYFWQIVVGNTPSHLTRSVLEWFGYDGEVYSSSLSR
jgi:hypothetical protein